MHPVEQDPHQTIRRKNLRAVASAAAVATMLFAVAAMGLGALRLTSASIETAAATVSDNLLHPYRVPDSELGGMHAMVGGEAITFASLETDITVDAQGDIANVTVVQLFSNPAPTPTDATYVFPLPHGAAVHSMTMEVGNERIRAQIDRIEEATATFEEAQANGQAAALVIQERPNVFTQRIANLVPGMPIRVELSYVQQVPRVDGEYELTVPLVVGPRFNPEGAATFAPTSTAPAAHDQLNAALQQNPFVAADAPEVAGRVAIEVNLDAGTTIAGARSTSHRMAESWAGPESVQLTLVDERIPDDRDFRLVYELGDDELGAAMLSHRDQTGGYFTLRVDPPESATDEEVVPRELVFVIDTSGSMGGDPLDACKAFMRRSLAELRPTDSFRIVRFGDDSSEFSPEPLIASNQNLEDGLDYVQRLSANGGTRMMTGIDRALSAPTPDGNIRLVVFLTDGYIGNDSEVLAAIADRIGDARLFSFGVGAAVNRYLLDEMGRRGRGFSRYVGPADDAEAVVAEFSERLRSPVLTDVWIDWGDANVTETYPSEIPDVFAGYPIRVAGRFASPGSHTVTVHGRAGSEEIELPIEVSLANQPSARTRAIPLVWAQAAIGDRMGRFDEWRSADNSDRDRIKDEVVQLGLEHSLVTRWTAFVAVSEAIVNSDPSGSTQSAVPTAMVDGVGYGTSFTGSATPEPATWIGLLLAGGLVRASRRRRS